jgi:DNA-binding LytR/AlgR family response regulator
MNTVQGEVGKPISSDTSSINDGRIIVKERNDVIVLKIADILYLNSENGKTNIVTKNGCYKSQSSLGTWENKLKSSGFVRCHRSFIVNSAYIMRMIHILGDYKELVLDYCNVNIPISRQKVNKVKAVLGIS